MSAKPDMFYLNNPFSEEVLHSFKFFENINKREGFTGSGKIHHLMNSREQYILIVNKNHSAIASLIDQLYLVEIFVRRFPAKEFYLKNNINQLTFIQYHLEVFFHKIHTILELMKLLVNNVFELNIKPKDCDWKKLVSHLGLKAKPLVIVDIYYKTFRSIIEARHSNTHRGVYYDPEKDFIEIAAGFFRDEMNNRLGIENDNIFEPCLPKYIVNYKVKEYRKERLKLIKKAQNSVVHIIFEFFKSLHGKFHEVLKSKE